MGVLLAVVGLMLIAVVVREVFNDLFHPGSAGALSDWSGRALFELFKRRPRQLPLAGPLALMAVIVLWIAGLVLGFALVYVHAYPAGFRTSTGVVPPAEWRFLSVLHFSFETLITLGYGDLVPQSWLVRFAASTEGLVGFGLLTAFVSSIVLLYPALARMRVLAREVCYLVDAEKACGIALADSGSDVILSGLARQVAHVRVDLIHFPIVYYFTSVDVNGRVATWMKDLARFARDGAQPIHSPEVRLAAMTLDRALDEFSRLVDERFLRTGSRNRQEILEAFAADQLSP